MNINQEQLMYFLFSKIISLQTEVVLQKTLLTALCKTINPENKICNELFDSLKKSQEVLFQEQSQLFLAELKGISNDFETLIQDYLKK